MKLLVIGGGGREHAIVWKLKQNPTIKKIYCIPGNGGISQLAECVPLPLNDFSAIARFVEEKGIQHTVVGPEQPLVWGIVDFFRERKLPVFGPDAAGARIEGSKIFSKNLMKKYGIPTAAFAEFEESKKALVYLDSLPEGPVVVKADGLAAGKGSVVCDDVNAARRAVRAMMETKVFSDAGSRIVIEEFMEGEEASLFVVSDGKDYRLLAPAQDFKRALDDDQGRNTGGMGSYSPPAPFTAKLQETAVRTIVEPTLDALASEGIAYTGILYCGLMLTREGPKVIEFNCRLGDPETQVVLPRLTTDLWEIVQAVEEQRVGELKIETDTRTALCVVAASGGYPDGYQKGKLISGLEAASEDGLIFHAGTRREGNAFYTDGGRVLAVTSLANDLEEAIAKAYRAMEKIHFDRMHYRKDIGRRALRQQ